MSEHHCDDCPEPTGGPLDAELVRIHVGAQERCLCADEWTCLACKRRADCGCTTDAECPEHWAKAMQHAKKMGTRDFVANPWGREDFLELARLFASDKQDTMIPDRETLRDMCRVLVDIIDEQRVAIRDLTTWRAG